MQLEEQVALVTGASRGLGLAICQALAAEGASIAMLARNAGELDTAGSLVRAMGHPVVTLPYDVTSWDDVEAAVRAVMETWGRLDILVNNAGTWAGGAAHEASEEQWDRLMDLNLKGLFLTCRHALPWMIEQKRGTVVGICSVGGLVGSAHSSIYAASKWGMRGFLESLAVELKPHGIRVCILFPHNIHTAGRAIEAESEERRRAIEPADVARLVAYACTAPENVVLASATILPASAAVTLGDVRLQG